jgi:hypothetical protein
LLTKLAQALAVGAQKLTLELTHAQLAMLGQPGQRPVQANLRQHQVRAALHVAGGLGAQAGFQRMATGSRGAGLAQTLCPTGHPGRRGQGIQRHKFFHHILC